MGDFILLTASVCIFPDQLQLFQLLHVFHQPCMPFFVKQIREQGILQIGGLHGKMMDPCLAEKIHHA